MTKSTKPKALWVKCFPKQHKKLMKWLAPSNSGKTMACAVAMGLKIPDGWPPYSKPTPKPRKSPRRAIRRRSVARSKEERIYRERVKVWIVGKICEYPYCGKPAECCHHVFGRRGKLLLWERGWSALCNLHHDTAHRFPAPARVMGLLAPMGKFNEQKLVTP